MGVWFTSDTHFQHKLVAVDIRGYSIGETTPTFNHDSDIVDVWNAYIRPDDVVWHLGDVFLGPEEPGLFIVGKLNGRKRLVHGNHDKVSAIHFDAWRHQPLWAQYFEAVMPYAKVKIGLKNKALLSHFPWNGDGEGERTLEERYSQFRLNRDPKVPRILIHGHTHSSLKVDGRDSIHVGWDAWHRPVSLEEVRELALSLEV
jgi:calcineurin-like phosphoesterase family protein